MKLKFKLPITWNSLTDAQLKKVASLYFSDKNGVIFDFLLFKILVSHKWYKFLLTRKINILFKNILIEDIKALYLDFYQKQNLTRFIKKLKIKTKSFYGPAARGTNLTIGEFSICEDLFLGFSKNIHTPEGLEYLQYLGAVLYQPSKKRQPFIKNELPGNASLFKKLSTPNLLAIALSYRGCKDYIASLEKYKIIFPKPKPNSNQAIKRKATTTAGVNKLILSVSETGVFGNYEATFNTNLYTFLDYYAEKLRNMPNE